LGHGARGRRRRLGAGSEVILLEDGTPAVRTVLNWVVAAPFVGGALGGA
jgi:hypothetical protein